MCANHQREQHHIPGHYEWSDAGQSDVDWWCRKRADVKHQADDTEQSADATEDFA
jgi:hypothetical protein